MPGMRLLNVYSLEFSNFQPQMLPPYAAASHRWNISPDFEVSLRDFREGRASSKPGFQKLQSFCNFVKTQLKDIQWLWMDTCCINQENHHEVSKAVNSMFKWYQSATVCLAYLADVTDNRLDASGSEWFRRGWTLQELLAPELVIFLSRDWRVIGHKGTARISETCSSVAPELGPSLIEDVAKLTHIPEEVLICYEASKKYTSEVKLQWRGERKTTEPEDRAYCMLGIFGVTMSLIYGEGESEALRRMLKKLSRQQDTAISGSPMAHGTPMSVIQGTTASPEPVQSKDMLRPAKTFVEKPVTTQPATTQPVRSLSLPSNRPMHYLDRQEVSQHVLRRSLQSPPEQSAELHPITIGGREGYIISGEHLENNEIAELKRKSREHNRTRRLERRLIS